MLAALQSALSFGAAITLCCLIYSGITHAHAGHAEQLRRLNLAIERNPQDQALFIRRGAVHAETQHFSLAEADFLKADSLGSPNNTAYNRGLLYYQMGDLERALEYFTQHLKQHPDSAPGYESRAKVWRSMGNKERAIADLRKNIRVLQRPHPGNYIAAAELLEQLPAIADALELLDEGLVRLGITPQLQRKAIALELLRANTAGAVKRMRSLREPLHANPKWKIELASLLLTAGESDEALNLLRSALDELATQRATPARAALTDEAMQLLAPPGASSK